MSETALATISISDLEHVAGGDGAAAATSAALRIGSKAVLRTVPIVGQVLTVADATYSAAEDYNKARANGDGVLSSIGSGGLGALNSLTFGFSNWALGRD